MKMQLLLTNNTTINFQKEATPVELFLFNLLTYGRFENNRNITDNIARNTEISKSTIHGNLQLNNYPSYKSTNEQILS